MSSRGVVVVCLVVAACSDGPKIVKPPEPPPQAPPRFDVTWVREAADVETLALDGSEEALAELRGSMGEGIADSDFAVFTDGAASSEGLPTLAGAPIVAVMRLDDDEDGPSCSTMTTFGGGGAGQSREGFRVSTEGVCGGIAVLHSLIELGITTREGVSNGDNFKEDEMGRAQGRNKRSMTVDQLIQRHTDAGAGDCRKLGMGDGFSTANKGVFERFLRDLEEKEGEQPPWDCTLRVFTRGPGGITLAHFEHVESIQTRDGTTTITTTNGLAQGNGTSTVPASPGTNTWTCNPGAGRGANPMELTDSTHPDKDNYKRALPPVGNVSAVCCRKPR